MRTVIGLVADTVHFCLLRPIYGARYPAARLRWDGDVKDFRREGVV